MSSLFSQSVGASLALHAAAVLAGSKERMRAAEISEKLGASEAHLSKVMQRLFRAGLVRGQRGRRGGFALSRPPEEITLREVYEAIEGPLSESICPFDVPICAGASCPLGEEFKRAASLLIEYLSSCRLSEYRPSFFAKEDANEA